MILGSDQDGTSRLLAVVELGYRGERIVGIDIDKVVSIVFEVDSVRFTGTGNLEECEPDG